MDGKEITPTSRNYLGNRKEFDLDKEVIIDFCDFAVQFFENVWCHNICTINIVNYSAQNIRQSTIPPF